MLDPRTEDARLAIEDVLATMVANHPHASTSSAVFDQLSDHGRYADRLPCLASEASFDDCVDGTIAVRTQPPAPDRGIHLCPSGLPAGSRAICPTYASGEIRFASALVDVVDAAAPV
jgi:hypothetical protein